MFGEHTIEPLLTQAQIETRIEELAQTISRDFQDRDLMVVGVLTGSFVFVADLVRRIELPLAVDFLGLSSYGSGTESSGIVKITKDLSSPIEGKDVLIIEDIIDTGLTMRYLLENLSTRQPASLRVCTLLHKPSKTQMPVQIDYVGFSIEDKFVIGYGLDLAERYRNLPYIGHIVS